MCKEEHVEGMKACGGDEVLGEIKIKTSAPGNLFFVGEHAVVYGHPSINVAIGRRTFVEGGLNKKGLVDITSSAYGREAHVLEKAGPDRRGLKIKELGPFFEVMGALRKKFNIEEGCTVRIESEIPVESGMSSSTAVLSAFLKFNSELYGLNIGHEKYFEWLYPLQKKIHGGKASGSEIISSSLGGFNRIQKVRKDGKDTIEWKYLGEHTFSVVIGDTGVRAPTALTVGTHVPSLMKRRPEFVEGCWNEISELCEEAEKAIKNENAQKLGRIMNDNQSVLKRMGLSHPKLDDCIEEALEAGALGAKLSGAGWGGVMFALVNPEDQQSVKKAIEATGARGIITEIGVEGVEACSP